MLGTITDFASGSDKLVSVAPSNAITTQNDGVDVLVDLNSDGTFDVRLIGASGIFNPGRDVV